MDQGGWGDPSVHKYHEANQLRSIVPFMEGTSERPWVGMEATRKQVQLIKQTVFGVGEIGDLKWVDNPSLYGTLKIWKKWKNKLILEISPLLPFLLHPRFSYFRAKYKVLVITFKALHCLGLGYLRGRLLPYNPPRTLRSSGENLLQPAKSR